MLLCFPDFFDGKSEIETDIKNSTDFLLQCKQENGNYPPCPGEERDKYNELVHWCHGAPGVVYLLVKAYLHWREEKYIRAVFECGDLIWKQGLLHKGPGICHGVAGTIFNLSQSASHFNYDWPISIDWQFKTKIILYIRKSTWELCLSIKFEDFWFYMVGTFVKLLKISQITMNYYSTSFSHLIGLFYVTYEFTWFFKFILCFALLQDICSKTLDLVFRISAVLNLFIFRFVQSNTLF